MRCSGSLKSGDSIMLSCLSPRRPCCGPNAAVSFTPAAARASSECTRPALTDAGWASSATRRPASGLRKPGSSSSRSMPNFIELQSEGVAVGEVGLSRRMAQRPVRRRAVGFLDHRRQAKAQFACGWMKDARFQFQDRVSALQGDFRIRRRQRHALAVALEAVRRPLARRREIEFLVSLTGGRGDEQLAAGVLPEALADARRARLRVAIALEVDFEAVGALHAVFGCARPLIPYSAMRCAGTRGMTTDHG